MVLCFVSACNESKLAGDSEQRPGSDNKADKTGDTGHKNGDNDDNYESTPAGQAIVRRVGKLFAIKVDLSNTQMPQGVERVRLHAVDADGRELPEGNPDVA